MSDVNEFTDRDSPIEKLVPHAGREIHPQPRRRIEASLCAAGLLEPLVIFAREDHFEILDGNARAIIMREMGVKTGSCILRS